MSAFKNVPDPSFEVIEEDGKWKAELSIHIARKGRMDTKETRIRGPKRESRREAQIDGHELKKTCLLAGCNVEIVARKKQTELLRREWTKQDLEEFEEVAKQLDELIEERKRLDKLARLDSRVSQKYQPISAGTWSACGPLMPRPDWGGPWSVYQRQDAANGKFYPHLYFNTSKNEYHYNAEKKYAPAAPPALPQTVPLSCRHASKTKPNDFSLVLSDLHRTGVMMKQRLDFLDLPAACMCLFDNLETNSGGDVSFLAKNLHRHLLTKLSSRHTEWEDFELRDLLVESLEALDSQWQDTPNGFSGAGAAVALIVGSRLTAASFAGSVVVFVNLSDANAPAKMMTRPASCDNVSMEDLLRIRSHGGIIDDDGITTQRPSEETPAERINRSRHSFETLGIIPQEFANIVKVYRKLTLQVHPDKCRDEGATEAFAKLEKAKEALLTAYGKEPKVLSELYEMFALFDEAPVLRMNVLREIEAKARHHTKIVNYCKDDVMKAQNILMEAQALLKQNLVEEKRTTRAPFTSALGLRSLKKPFPVISSRPTVCMPEDLAPGKYAIALLSSSASIRPGNVAEIGQVIRDHVNKPRACAMAICKAHSCSSVVTFATVDETGSLEPPQKKQKTEQTERVFLRHILVKFSGCTTDVMTDRDPGPSAPWRTRTLREAEDTIVDAMPAATRTLSEFSAKCREVSDCKSAMNPMSMCGHVGWVSRGQLEEKLDTAAFDLALDGVSDVIQTDRGLQILRRVG